MAFGTGSAIAHRAVGAAAGMFGGSDDKVEGAAPAASADAATSSYPVSKSVVDCHPFQRDFAKCLQEVRVCDS